MRRHLRIHRVVALRKVREHHRASPHATSKPSRHLGSRVAVPCSLALKRDRTALIPKLRGDEQKANRRFGGGGALVSRQLEGSGGRWLCHVAGDGCATWRAMGAHTIGR